MGQNVTIIISSKCVFVIYMFLSVVKLSMFRCRAMDDAHIQRQHTASNIFNGEKHDLYCVAIKLKTRSIRVCMEPFLRILCMQKEQYHSKDENDKNVCVYVRWVRLI